METTMVTIPMGTTVIETNELNFIRDDRATMSNTLNILKSMVMNRWVEDKKKGYAATMYCAELADVLGLELPVIEREVVGNE